MKMGLLSEWINEIDSLTAKEQAGHADVQTTMEIYTHLNKVYKAKQISKLDEYLSKIG